MRKLFIIFAVLLFLSLNFYAQEASSYFPANSNYTWQFEVIPLDSVNNEMNSLAYYKVDSLIGTHNYNGKPANIIDSKVGYAGLPVFPSIDSTYISFEGSEAFTYVKFFSLDSLINNILPSTELNKNLSKKYNSKSSGDWYSFYHFAETENHPYQILSIDTTIDLDTIKIALRFEEKGSRLADETVYTKAGNFNCKKFLIQKIVSYLFFSFPIPLITENDTVWIAQDKWIVKDVVPTTKLDLSALGFGTQYFPGFKQVLIPKIPTAINEGKEIVNDFKLYQNYPNPFNPSTKIKYSVPGVGTSLMKFLQLKVYDILGNEVATLVNGYKPAGNYEVEFNPSQVKNGLSSGVYFYRMDIYSDRLKNGTSSITKKLIYLK